MIDRRAALCLALLAACNGSAGDPELDGAVQPDVRIEADRGADAAGEPGADGATCAAPLPFVPPGQPSGWKHTTTALLVVTQGAPNHRGQDVVVAPGADQLLIGKFAYGPFDKDLKQEDVEVFIQEDPPCGAWVSLGVVETSEDGQHGTQYGIEDDGGRVFFVIPPARARPVGWYPVRMLVKGDHSVAAFSLYVVAPSTDAVVFDIDGTLTTDDFQLVTQLFSELLSGGYVPAAYPGGGQVARAWADKGYLVLYLTGRPDFLRAITRGWLVGQGLPPGPLHLTDTNAQALPTSAGVGQYKADFLLKMTGEAKLALRAAYGNAATDIEAYAAAGVDKGRTFIIGPNAGHDGTVAVADYPGHLPFAQAAPPASVQAPRGSW